MQAFMAGITYLLTLFLPALFCNFSSLEKFIKITEPRKPSAGKSSDIVH